MGLVGGGGGYAFCLAGLTSLAGGGASLAALRMAWRALGMGGFQAGVGGGGAQEDTLPAALSLVNMRQNGR